MTSETDLTARLNEALRLIEEATEAAAARVLKGPDNPAIQGRYGVGFSISMAAVLERRNWDPFAHDWVAQYKHIAELLRARRFSALREVLANGGYRDRSHGWRGFASEVIQHARSITGDLQMAVALTDAGRLAKEQETSPAVEIERAEPRQLIGRQMIEPSTRSTRRRP